jgi:RecB family exonuclease
MGLAPALLQTPADWAEAIASLPAWGALPLRTVLVPSERHAHALRRGLVRAGRARVLGGTRFVGPATLAREVLEAAGRDVRPGEGALRPARLLALFAGALPLEHLDLDLVRRTPGWAEAIASAIGDLESAGLAPDRVPATTARWRDLAVLWRRLDAAAGRSWTAARLYAGAAALLEAGHRPDTGPVLAAVSGRETAAQARFLRALPDARIALLAVRPLRDRHLARVAALYGPEASVALATAPLPSAAATERDVLARHLFASPEILADPERPRSRGVDGTVRLEEHAGVEAEVEAAAEWVAREVLERRTPLEEIAVLFPVHDPMAGLLASRLAGVPRNGGPLPVHVAGGLPAVSRAGGARTLALLRALRSFLSAEALAALLPALRAPVGDRAHLSHEEATVLAWSLGTAGGSAARPELALEWPPRAAARQAQLEAELARLQAGSEADAPGARDLRALLDSVRAVRPALDALVGVARLVAEGRPLAALASAALEFMERWLLDPGPGVPVHALLAGALEGVRGDAVGEAVRGAEALAVMEDHLLGLRVPTARFGEPAVYVGTVGSAAGLDFQAVRILGLCEGALPSPGREDAILPDGMREEADAARVPVSADRALGQLHALDLAVRGARRALALSAPRTDLERSERETSSVLVEAGAALGRPDAVEPAVIPGLASLARTSFAPARADAAAFRDAHPLTAGAWLERAAARGDVPPDWGAGGHLDLSRILDLRDREALGPADGVLGRVEPFPGVPGLVPEKPVSASSLEDLLACPLRFLYRRILRWEEPAGVPPLRELDPLTYGGLFHEVMEAFYTAHGEAFVRRRKRLADWKRAATEIAHTLFAERLASYPLVGHGIEAKERKRLLDDVDGFLDHDWREPLDRFVAVERSFGTDAPLTIEAGGETLHVRGYVDRIDVQGDHALLRDLKTGNAHPRQGREAQPTPARDIQLGLYGIVARQLAASWGIPAQVQAAYVYVRTGEKRAFGPDYADLERAAKGWLGVAAHALSQRAFPPTPDLDDCTYCPYAPVCGTGVPARSAAAAASGAAGGAVAEFLALKEQDE